MLPGLLELAEGTAPTHLVICDKDRVLPHPRFTRHFTTHLPKDTQITHLEGVGHVPMFEAPDAGHRPDRRLRRPLRDAAAQAIG